jgi:hypothetical protein
MSRTILIDGSVDCEVSINVASEGLSECATVQADANDGIDFASKFLIDDICENKADGFDSRGAGANSSPTDSNVVRRQFDSFTG